MRIQFKNLNINEIKQSSGVFNGENYLYKWKDVKKVNEGFGTLTGQKNHYSKGRHIVSCSRSKKKEEESETDL